MSWCTRVQNQPGAYLLCMNLRGAANKCTELACGIGKTTSELVAFLVQHLSLACHGRYGIIELALLYSILGNMLLLLAYARLGLW